MSALSFFARVCIRDIIASEIVGMAWEWPSSLSSAPGDLRGGLADPSPRTSFPHSIASACAYSPNPSHGMTNEMTSGVVTRLTTVVARITHVAMSI